MARPVGGVYAITAAAFVVVGLLLLLLLAGQSAGGDPWDRLRSAVVLALPTYFLLVVVPAGGPGAVMGAWLAARTLRSAPPPASLASWLVRGLGAGAACGAVNAATWFGVLNVAAPNGRALLVMTLVGGAAGAIVGMPIAVYCWRRVRADS